MLKLTRHRASVECLSCLKCYDATENDYQVFFILQSSRAGIITDNQLAASAFQPDLLLSASSERPSPFPLRNALFKKTIHPQNKASMVQIAVSDSKGFRVRCGPYLKGSRRPRKKWSRREAFVKTSRSGCPTETPRLLHEALVGQPRRPLESTLGWCLHEVFTKHLLR